MPTATPYGGLRSSFAPDYTLTNGRRMWAERVARTLPIPSSRVPVHCNPTALTIVLLPQIFSAGALHAQNSTSRGRLRHLFSPSVLFRVDAAWPRLGRAFRTAPVSRQTKDQSRLARTALSLMPCHPPSASVLSLPPASACFFPLRSSEEKNKPIPAEREKT